MILAGTGGGTQLGGRALRWEHVLLIRRRLRRFLPSGSRHLLLRRPRSHLAETRGSGHLQLSLWLVAPADAGSCQQVLCSGAGNVSMGSSAGIPGCR